MFFTSRFGGNVGFWTQSVGISNLQLLKILIFTQSVVFPCTGCPWLSACECDLWAVNSLILSRPCPRQNVPVHYSLLSVQFSLWMVITATIEYKWKYSFQGTNSSVNFLHCFTWNSPIISNETPKHWASRFCNGTISTRSVLLNCTESYKNFIECSPFSNLTTNISWRQK